MTSRSTTKARQRDRLAKARDMQKLRDDRRSILRVVLAAVGVAVVVIGLGYALSRGNDVVGGSAVSYDVGEPGPGQQAPDFTLAATTGEQVSLTDYRGQTVLLYFQEGLMCQPCWDQMRDVERIPDTLGGVGVDTMLSITTDPIDLVTRKVGDDGITTPILSDPDLAVSRAYHTNLYGMMGETRNGHSFILVGPDGTIQWRADYGGEPNYTMYVPVDQLLADLKAGRQS